MDNEIGNQEDKMTTPKTKTRPPEYGGATGSFTPWPLPTDIVNWMLNRIAAQDHGCLTGDCPHYQQADCVKHLIRSFMEEWSNATRHVSARIDDSVDVLVGGNHPAERG